MSVAQILEQVQSVLTQELTAKARELGAVKRQRVGGLSAMALVISVIFGFWQEPQLRLSGLAHVVARYGIAVSASALCQRFSPAWAALFEWVLQRVTQISMHQDCEPIDIAFLQQFSAVIVEDSSTIGLPTEYAEQWAGCGGSTKSKAALKLFVCWDVLRNVLLGPSLLPARTNDHHTPFALDALPAGALYLADLGFFGVLRLQHLARGTQSKRFFVSRLHAATSVYQRSGHCIELAGVVPQQEGQLKELGVVLGKRQGLPVRLLMLKVPQDAYEQRVERIKDAACKQGRPVSEHRLAMARWTILITNLPRRRASGAQVLVLLRLRWQIERLFRLWKEEGEVDEWRSRKPDRQMCECYGKLTAMVLQQVLIQEGCGQDPYRSIWKAAACVRREANRLMMALWEGTLSQTLASILFCLQVECRLDRRRSHPCTTQLLLEGLDWTVFESLS